MTVVTGLPGRHWLLKRKKLKLTHLKPVILVVMHNKVSLPLCGRDKFADKSTSSWSRQSASIQRNHKVFSATPSLQPVSTMGNLQPPAITHQSTLEVARGSPVCRSVWLRSGWRKLTLFMAQCDYNEPFPVSVTIALVFWVYPLSFHMCRRSSLVRRSWRREPDSSWSRPAEMLRWKPAANTSPTQLQLHQTELQVSVM